MQMPHSFLVTLLTIGISFSLLSCDSGSNSGNAPTGLPETSQSLDLNRFVYGNDTAVLLKWSRGNAPVEYLPAFSAVPYLSATLTLFEIRYRYTNLPQLTLKLSRPGNDKAAVYNHGHGGLPTAKETFAHDLLRGLLDTGHDVFITSMPLTGLNTPSSQGKYWIVPRGTNAKVALGPEFLNLLSHEVYEYIDDPDHYIHYFIDGALLPLRNEDYRSVSFIGLSGGGGSGLVACAIHQFDNCLLVAGFLPDYLRVANGAHAGDIEQFSRSLYHHFNVEKLMTLAQARSRNLMMYYNKNDTCCFFDPEASRFKNDFPEFKIVITDLDIHGFDANRLLGTINGSSAGSL